MLVGANMPAVLVEMGFISNPAEEKLLSAATASATHCRGARRQRHPLPRRARRAPSWRSRRHRSAPITRRARVAATGAEDAVGVTSRLGDSRRGGGCGRRRLGAVRRAAPLVRGAAAGGASGGHAGDRGGRRPQDPRDALLRGRGRLEPRRRRSRDSLCREPGRPGAAPGGGTAPAGSAAARAGHPGGHRTAVALRDRRWRGLRRPERRDSTSILAARSRSSSPSMRSSTPSP